MISDFRRYIQSEKRFSVHTVKAYTADLEQFSEFLSQAFDVQVLTQATPEQLRSWMVHLMQSGISARSIRRKVSTLKTYYRYQRKKGVIQANPASGLALPKSPKSLPAFIQAEDFMRLWEQNPFSDDFAGLRDRMVLETFYVSGMRRAELIGLKDSDVDFAKRQLKVLGKRQKERLIPLPETYLKRLEKYMEYRAQEFGEVAEIPLFTTAKGKAMYPKFVYNLVGKYLPLITTLEKKSPHLIRHSFATQMANNGAPLNAIKELLGHASLAATQIYTHNTIEKLKQAYKQAHPKS